MTRSNTVCKLERTKDGLFVAGINLEKGFAEALPANLLDEPLWASFKLPGTCRLYC